MSERFKESSLEQDPSFEENYKKTTEIGKRLTDYIAGYSPVLDAEGHQIINDDMPEYTKAEFDISELKRQWDEYSELFAEGFTDGLRSEDFDLDKYNEVRAIHSVLQRMCVAFISKGAYLGSIKE